MDIDEKIYFVIRTPLDIEVRTTIAYWTYLITMKHPVMNGKDDVVKAVLQSPDEIRQSRTDKEVFLYYKQSDKLYCAVARHMGTDGFLITA
ncbi:MAG: DUF4258 domain-containing protein [Nitrospirae bacterium]|nr:DUF4258 domain-containing protein [Nitrospirota bacterium]MCL5978159.1 DUF4258 domain-containing protein [Nitrospirota bacterium]